MTINGALRLLLENFAVERLGNVVITEFPKSGGTWAGQLISEVLGKEFPRNRFPRFKNQILHCHSARFLNENNTITVLRDGRDVYISYFYHSLFENDLYNQVHVKRMRKSFCGTREVSIENDLADFIEFVHNEKLHGKKNWSSFVNSRLSRSSKFIKYEDLLDDAVLALKKLLTELDMNHIDEKNISEAVLKYDFNTQKNKYRTTTSKNKNWLRAGKKDQWKNVYCADSRDAFNKFNYTLLSQLEYAEKREWVS